MKETLLLIARSLYFYNGVQQMDLLYQAALSWRNILGYKYYFEYGKKGVLYSVCLEFKENEFYHVAGFPHLNDISWPYRFSQSNALQKVLNGNITEEMICKSIYYEPIVQPKLLALAQIKNFLDHDFTSYVFNPKKVQFGSKLEAKYLLANHESDIMFLFSDVDTDGTFFTRSAFMKGDRDFTANQTKIALLKKEVEEKSSNTKTILYDRNTTVLF